MISFKEMRKEAKIYIILMLIAGIGDIIISYIIKNIYLFLFGIMFLLEILDTYSKEEDRIIIEENDEILDKYYDLVGKQNREIWQLRRKVEEYESKEKKTDEKNY